MHTANLAPTHARLSLAKGTRTMAPNFILPSAIDECTMHIKIEAPHCMPERAYDSQGYDLKALEVTQLVPNKVNKVRTGVCMEIPKGFVGIIKDKSSKALEGLQTHGGVIDSDYRGEVIVLLTTPIQRRIGAGHKVAQLLLVPCVTPRLEVVEELEETERGESSFGSSTTNNL